MRDLGFDLGQGYLFAKPMELRRFVRTIVRTEGALGAIALLAPGTRSAEQDKRGLTMPAWTTSGGRFIRHKLVNVFPDNAKLGKPAVHCSYALMSGDTVRIAEAALRG